MAHVRKRAPDLPDLKRALTAIFTGAAKGWETFTTEFRVGGPFDKLTVEERSRLWIPSTNDANEGGLSSLRQFKCHRPNGDVQTFSDHAAASRNTTEAFIEAKATHADHLYVMRAVRNREGKGRTRKFRQNLERRLREKATARPPKRAETLRKNAERQAQLDGATCTLILDERMLDGLNKTDLQTQMRIHWKILQDPVLAKTNKSTINTKPESLEAVREAIARHKERQVPLGLSLTTLSSVHCGKYKH
ncbi:hypothetical protein GGX14DRAFT_576976 [Mycena pura]|uniref:Uncharacterized protein n=1 Tax=Mycena pura TaxID=153505 RepID=A0AAD6UZJ2_9AGAR|nr:hypothetical protein GGX14DRAFT_576976 [Mycena pura]